MGSWRLAGSTPGDRHTAAQPNLFNRLLGCLHHCLQTGKHYDEAIAFPITDTSNLSKAARQVKRVGCLHQRLWTTTTFSHLNPKTRPDRGQDAGSSGVLPATTDQKFTKAIGHPTGAAGSVIVVRRVAPLRRTPRTPSSRITPLHRAPGHRATFPGDTLYWQAAHWRPLS